MAEALQVELRDGRLHVPASTYAQALAGHPAVALLAREDGWWLIPLKGGAGGLQLKMRTAGGDRVVEAREFFRAQGVEDTHAPCTLELAFEPSRGAFRLVAPAAARGG